jgi:hypothetical protein
MRVISALYRGVGEGMVGAGRVENVAVCSSMRPMVLKLEGKWQRGPPEPGVSTTKGEPFALYSPTSGRALPSTSPSQPENDRGWWWW